MPQRPGTPRLLRAINDQAALRLLLDRGPLTRSQLGALTGLSKPTASQLLARLEAQGLVHAVGELEGGRGPNAQLYAVSPAAAYVIGVAVGPAYVGPTRIRAAVADITGEVRGRSELTTEDAADPVEVVHRAVAGAVDGTGVELADINAIVIGTPGLVDPTTGDIGFAWDLPSWRRGLLAALRTDLRKAVVLENDVNLAAIAEQHSGSARDHKDFVLLWVGRGLGLAVVLGGELYRGASGGAGEIGWLPVPGRPVQADDHGPGQLKGGFQALVGAEAVRLLAAEHGFGAPGADGPTAAAAAVREALSAGDRGAAFLDELARRLALGVVSICVVLDPGLVVLGGEVSRAGGTELASRVEAAVGRISPVRPRVRVTAIKTDPVLEGAILRALDLARREVFGSTTEQPFVAPAPAIVDSMT